MKTKITVKTEMEICLPSLPNFVRTPKKDICIPIEDLTKEQFQEYCGQWVKAMDAKYKKKKRDKQVKEIKGMQEL